MCSLEAINLNQNPCQILRSLYCIQLYCSRFSVLRTVSSQRGNELPGLMDEWLDSGKDKGSPLIPSIKARGP